MAESLLRLKVESAEYDAKLKRAQEGLTRYIDNCKKAGGTLEYVEKETLDYVRAVGQMDTVSRTATGKLAEMKKTFIELSAQYRRMTEQERNSPVGKAMAQSLDQLKGRISETRTALQSVNLELQGSRFGQFGSLIDSVGQKMGVTGNITELLTSRTALMTAGVGASIAVLTKATEAWAHYNQELSMQSEITTVTTGLKGGEADHMTDTMRALVDTYNVDFRNAVNAANTLMTQFGLTGNEAINLIKDGMQGMIHGDGEKLLQMIQQYAPSFRDAGISAAQLVAIIHNSEGGIFTDQNMNAIVMGIKNIRLMTKATSDALAKMGIDGEEMTRKLNDGSITIFDALKQVVKVIRESGTSSQAVGEVMQYVFGRQGAAAGTNLAKAIETLNLNLEQTKRQTGELGESYRELQAANERLNKAIRDAFGYNGWETMANGIKAELVKGLTQVLEISIQIKDTWTGTSDNNIFNAIYESALRSLGPLGNVLAMLRDIRKEQNSGGTNGSSSKPGYEDMDKVFDIIKNGKTREDRERLYRNYLANINRKLANVGKERRIENEDGSVTFAIDSDDVQRKKRNALLNRRTMLIQNEDALLRGNYQPTPEVKDVKKDGKTVVDNAASKIIEKAVKDQTEIQQRQAKVNELTQQYVTLAGQINDTNDERLVKIREEIALQEKQIEKLKLYQQQASGKFLGGGDVQTTDLGKSSKGKNDRGIQQNTISFGGFTTIEGIGGGLDSSALEIFNAATRAGEQLADAGKDTRAAWQAAAGAISSVGGALQGIQDPGVKIMSIIGEAIANVASGFAQASAKEGKGGVWYWIAATAAGLATMVSTISSIRAATGFAGGGIVPGNNMSGDNLYGPQFGINSGELILNRAQQGIIASQLQGGGNNNNGSEQVARVSGEQLYITINNFLKRSGKGELSTWK